jgi:hypothetical protein
MTYPDDVVEKALATWDEQYRHQFRTRQEAMQMVLAAAEAAMWRPPETAKLGETVLGAYINFDGTPSTAEVAWIGPLSKEWESRHAFSHGFSIRKPDAIRDIPTPPAASTGRE